MMQVDVGDLVAVTDERFADHHAIDLCHVLLLLCVDAFVLWETLPLSHPRRGAGRGARNRLLSTAARRRTERRHGQIGAGAGVEPARLQRAVPGAQPRDRRRQSVARAAVRARCAAASDNRVPPRRRASEQCVNREGGPGTPRIHRGRRPSPSRPRARAAAPAAAARIEHVGIAVRVLPRDRVASAAPAPSRRAGSTRAGACTSCVGACPARPGRASAMRAIGGRASATSSASRHARAALHERRRAAGVRPPRRARQRRAQQHDAEVGVAAGGRLASPRPPLDALAHRARRREQRPAPPPRALATNCAGAHAVAGRCEADVARLAHRDVERAGAPERTRAFERRGAVMPARRARLAARERASLRSSRSSTSARAMLKPSRAAGPARRRRR